MATNTLPGGQKVIDGALAVVNADGTAIGSSGGATGVADNGAFIDGTSLVQPVGFIVDEVAGTPLTENDIGAARMDSKRAMVHVIEDATTRGQRLAINAVGSMQVHGQVASDGVAAGNPLLAGARASAAAPTNVSTDGDAVAFWTTLKGALNVLLRDINAVDAMGEVQATPTANTVLGRLKDLVSSGTPYSAIFQPVRKALGSSVNPAQYTTDATGWNKLQFFVIGISTPSAAAITINWSTTVNDQAACASAVNAVIDPSTGKIAVPDGSFVLNTVTLPAAPSTNGPFYEIEIDPLTPVKSFGMGLSADVAGLLVVAVGLKAA